MVSGLARKSGFQYSTVLMSMAWPVKVVSRFDGLSIWGWPVEAVSRVDRFCVSGLARKMVSRCDRFGVLALARESGFKIGPF